MKNIGQDFNFIGTTIYNNSAGTKGGGVYIGADIKVNNKTWDIDGVLIKENYANNRYCDDDDDSDDNNAPCNFK